MIEKNENRKRGDEEAEIKLVDKRHPLYIGTWKKSIPYEDIGFARDNEYDEPHSKRKKAILEKYPEIEKLGGPSNKTKYIIILHLILYIIGLFIMEKIKNKILFFIFCYFYGGSITSLSGVLVHECSHSLVSKSNAWNVFFGYLANIPILIPIFGSFKKYHLDHHFYLGVEDKDADLPLDIELKMVQGCTFTKIIYVMSYPIFYVCRSVKIKKEIVGDEIKNFIFQAIVLFITWKFFGIKALYYIAITTWIAYSIHPAAAHLIQEHFTFADGQETYSYYGPFNFYFLNIGYHTEHHDFSFVAWDKLPEIRKIAPEFYNNCYIQTSWFGVLYEFIKRPIYGPQSRVYRSMETHKRGRKMKAPI